eukprot:Plantae.Rhodophyta-Purpureofilum_apyrenoidigerum.ctg5466.p1 GENE.Plantae.Rhodophyta-Purpureofilum_apyrenoidigerum.ctg5466~~Plantae.Rhodophyta-Purpureofilum_apyrenoidigerum.ctg5466.p1  ORF type:complete len:129 (+),score=22.36 Plantae.Rhodophyta-Purpureofilum_apyrenoidigerum.ctg5466:229-615(+)
MADQYQQIGEAFVKHYYSTFDTNRANLGGLYQQNSMLSFEGQTFMGVESIVQKLVSLPFQRVRHEVTSYDAQPVVASQPNSILVLVSGHLLVDEENNPMKFSQIFHLLPSAGGNGYFVHNDMFRLNLA